MVQYDLALYDVLLTKLRSLEEDCTGRVNRMLEIILNQGAYPTNTILLAYDFFASPACVLEDDEYKKISWEFQKVRKSLSKLRSYQDSDAARLHAKSVPVESILSLRGIKVKRNMACCPLHDEKTPSFSIKPSTNTWKCFGCGKWGDSIALVMLLDNTSFKDAILSLA